MHRDEQPNGQRRQENHKRICAAEQRAKQNTPAAHRFAQQRASQQQQKIIYDDIHDQQNVNIYDHTSAPKNIRHRYYNDVGFDNLSNCGRIYDFAVRK